MFNLYVHRRLEQIKAKIDFVGFVEDVYNGNSRRKGKLTFSDFTKLSAAKEGSNKALALENLEYRFDENDSVFVKNSVNKDTAKAFLESLKADINNAISNPDVINDSLKDVTEVQTVYGIAPAMATAVTKNNNGMGLGFEYAKDNKAAIENFLKLFNIEGLNEEVYF